MLRIHTVIPKQLYEHLQRSPTMTIFEKVFLKAHFQKRVNVDCVAEQMVEDWKPTVLAGVSTVNHRNSKGWPLGQHLARWSSGPVSIQCLWGQKPHCIEESTPVRPTVSVWVQEMWTPDWEKDTAGGCSGSGASSEPTSGEAGLEGSCLSSTE